MTEERNKLESDSEQENGNSEVNQEAFDSKVEASLEGR
jgi:hypothetical protein